MIAKQESMRVARVPGLMGGPGDAIFTMLFERGVLPATVTKITLEPGSGCGFHEHTTDSELYYVLEGEVILMDDETEHVLHPGDCGYCPHGHSHGAINRSDAPASYLAVMLP